MQEARLPAVRGSHATGIRLHFVSVPLLRVHFSSSCDTMRCALHVRPISIARRRSSAQRRTRRSSRSALIRRSDPQTCCSDGSSTATCSTCSNSASSDSCRCTSCMCVPTVLSYFSLLRLYSTPRAVPTCRVVLFTPSSAKFILFLRITKS